MGYESALANYDKSDFTDGPWTRPSLSSTRFQACTPW